MPSDSDTPATLSQPKRNLSAHPSAGLLWERKLSEVLFEEEWARVPVWECFCMHPKSGLLLSVWNKVMSKVELEEPSRIVDQENPGCTQRRSETNRSIVAAKQDLFTKLFSSSGVTTCRVVHKCVERVCDWANTTTDKLHKVSAPCWDHHQF